MLRKIGLYVKIVMKENKHQKPIYREPPHMEISYIYITQSGRI